MTCMKIRKELVNYYYGDLDSKLKKDVEGHLKECPPCAAFLEEVGATLQMIDKNLHRERVDKGYIQGVYEKIEAKKKHFSFSISRLIPASAIIILLTIFGIYHYKGMKEEQNLLLKNYEIIKGMDMLEDMDIVEVLDILEGMDEA